MNNKQKLEILELELKNLEEEYETFPKKTFLAILYYESKINSKKRKIEKLRAELNRGK